MTTGTTCSRVSLYRRHKRLISALNSLLSNKLIDKTKYKALKNRVDELYSEWRKSMNESREKSSRPRGRPIPPDDRRNYSSCKCGCGRTPAPGQAYAFRSCAPLADFGIMKAAV